MHLFAGATVAGIARRLRLALRTVRRAVKADVKVPVVP
jgi:hypothetical protein